MLIQANSEEQVGSRNWKTERRKKQYENEAVSQQHKKDFTAADVSSSTESFTFLTLSAEYSPKCFISKSSDLLSGFVDY